MLRWQAPFPSATSETILHPFAVRTLINPHFPSKVNPKLQKMELLELISKTSRLLACEKESVLAELERIIFSDKRESFFEQWRELAGGEYSPALIQKIFQYYFSDRDEKKQDFTPESICRLVATLADLGEVNVVHDICAGSGALTLALHRTHRDALFICDELDNNALIALLFNLSFENVNAYVRHMDVLTNQVRKVYRIEPGKSGHADIVVTEDTCIPRADVVISNPPYNVKWTPPDELFADSRFQGWPMPPAGNANYAFILTALDALAESGRALFILPNGVLTAVGAEGAIRKELLHRGHVEQVIMLPEGMFESTGIPVSILALGKQAQANVRLMDARDMGTDEIREQRGQFGGNSHTRRTYRKAVRVFDSSAISEIVSSRSGKRVAIIPPQDIINKEDGILTPSRFSGVEPSLHSNLRDIGDIMDDINRISDIRNAIKITANEVVLQKLGLPRQTIDFMLENQRAAQDTHEKTKKLFAAFGRKLVAEDYLTITKSKGVFKLEANQGEGEPILMQQFAASIMPAWIHHIRLMNSEENRLLAELRDRLLPDLMSGKLDPATMT